MKLFAVIQDGSSKLQPAPSLSLMVENGPKGALNGESSSKGELWFQELFWQSKGAMIVDVK